MEIIFKGRQTDVPERFRDYATAKLKKLVRLDQKAIIVDVELSVERNPRQSSQKERVELTIWSRGPAIRAEAAAEDKIAALDLALAKLNSRLRRALDRRKNHHGTGAGAVTGASAGIGGGAGPGGTGPGGAGPGGRASASAAPPVPMARSGEPGPAAEPEDDGAAGGESLVPIQMDGDGPLLIRQKFHHARPISIDQALLEMELVGHDFYLFHDVQENTPSVVYRRHGYQYGVIRLVEHAADRDMMAEPSTSGVGARIPGRRRPERAGDERAAPAAQVSQDGASRGDKSAVLRPG
ncbi:MAG TPA: ribosome-associated translation inhibitor RaiA [Streptosporangiaceae bacterium]|nr:ribosome-associated translation inhibitor RaiA [Streptosporangiaceae bacterium]